MSITVYEKTPGGLYATSERTVETYRSGMVRVDQVFTCKNSAASTARQFLAVGNDFPGGNYPAIDGLKIYPEVKESRSTDGFTDFYVSAYGRVTSNIDLNYQIKTFHTLTNAVKWGFNYYEIYGEACIPIDGVISINTLPIQEKLKKPFDAYKIDYEHFTGLNFELKKYSKSKSYTHTNQDGSTYKRIYVRYYVDNIDQSDFWFFDPAVYYTEEVIYGGFKEVKFTASPSISLFYNNFSDLEI